ncbi:uncharacterized protein LOC115415138 isoform X2 [Sphaeramia orbicularis]|nr:uncharacterized protein LOC115415138 isoform X2 [Sphaeramia orbicularis]
MLSRKRPLSDRYEKEPPPNTKKCLSDLTTLLNRYHTDRTCCGDPEPCKAFVNGNTKHPTDTEIQTFFQQISSWTDSQSSGQKVLEHLKFQQATSEIFLSDSVNKKFLQFHRDISEECGAEDKQHSWAVIEKQEEIVMYGPYYPNYNNGEHSEDIIIKQTQELLESGAASDDWKVYVFTMNSPCLARNTEPCMLNLVQKAQEWWLVFGVKTHIGYVKCWGFKGTKETLFRVVNYSQVECIDQSDDHEKYVLTAKNRTNMNPLCENLYSVVKHLLRSGPVIFPLVTSVQGQDWRSYFKGMHSVLECAPDDVKTLLTQEVNGVTEAAQVLLSGRSESFPEHLIRGQAFAHDHTFNSQASTAVQDQMRLTFQQCWREMVQDKYTEFIRETLTEDFNQCTVQLFIKDILEFTKEYLQIGRIQFSEGLS